ncbi:MAG TPA: RdgB/HAM1 family non-canonical purine NTP pyrophosphatase [Mycobacteriales bacterium]|nr:RdgB/HAM1 family non-canonical purine NTP pyrophosphatase [Mycobacteriales bacterium]
MTAAQVVLATRNAGKVAELRRILEPYDVELVGLDAFPALGDVAETGATFADNALLKARETCRATGLVAIADDSGLTVDALNGMPGILSARWAGRHGDDDANLDLVLAQLRDVPDGRRGAAFVCAAAAVSPGGVELTVEERITGTLLRERRGSGGFGYDPIFVPVGEALTTAEMTADRKNEISHRGKAFRALAARLPEVLGTSGHRS